VIVHRIPAQRGEGVVRRAIGGLGSCRKPAGLHHCKKLGRNVGNHCHPQFPAVRGAREDVLGRFETIHGFPDTGRGQLRAVRIPVAIPRRDPRRKTLGPVALRELIDVRDRAVRHVEKTPAVELLQRASLSVRNDDGVGEDLVGRADRRTQIDDDRSNLRDPGCFLGRAQRRRRLSAGRGEQRRSQVPPQTPPPVILLLRTSSFPSMSRRPEGRRGGKCSPSSP
jgi:hypothetical protein